MIYNLGDTVEVRASKDLPWFKGTIVEVLDDFYAVELFSPVKASEYDGLQRQAHRDGLLTTVKFSKHLENLGVGWLHMRLLKFAKRN